MLKRHIIISVIFITLFSCVYLQQVNAYEFEESKNETLVNNLITEIYDSKQQYEDLAGEYDQKTVTIRDAVNSSYWWPIGSEVTVESEEKIFAKEEPYPTIITSEYGYRIHPLKGTRHLHTGVDIAGSAGNGIINVIAAKDGVVVYPTSEVTNDCPSSTTLSDCGGGYGNYVIIQHSDGNYTLYAHLDANSITVVAGESVAQGQVIAKMGSSGNSTGTHLHFEVREGQNTYDSTVDPLGYVSIDNPRTISTGGEFIAWLNNWEGHTKIDGDCYIVENIGDGVRTVGGGVTLEYNIDRFAQYGIDVADYPVGSKIPISIVDQIELEVANGKRAYIEGVIAKNAITLEEHQIQALMSHMYNTGNINGFVDKYKQYGNTQPLFDNWFYRCVMKGSIFEVGLTRRRHAEWALFHTGEYVYN